ncbi:protein kinase family protein [Bacillus salitolerans]|uniref:Protein kinase family protein n=1 Tax=Bacillus salitolerans TaxID=1437434 RepID=A0ABW4LS11_9BACI
MKNNILKNPACKVTPGTVIVGKWHAQSYRVMKPLGYGANGVVYLANGKAGQVALKISDNSMSITSEVNVLKKFSKVQGSSLGPSLLDVDDWFRTDNGITVPFYVMEFVNGDNFIEFIEKRGTEWTGILCSQLLLDLDKLHEAGWVFGDLKPDNLLVTGPPPKIRWLDVGGVTIQGRSIKEFTEFFDRGYWGMGSRVAEPTYDLFAVAMIMINASFPKRFAKTEDTKHQLRNVILTHSSLRQYHDVIMKAIEGKYSKALDMRRDLVIAMSKSNVSTSQPAKGGNVKANVVPKTKPTKKPANQSVKRTDRKSKKKKESFGLTETLLILLFLFLAYVLYIYGQLI